MEATINCMFRLALLALVALCAGCGGGAGQAELGTVIVTLPDGFKVKAEMLTREEDKARGMMFRDSLAEDRGLLFVHGAPGRYPYWMYQVKIPLDIIWMDREHRVEEISENTPPCKTGPRECPTYGGKAEASFVLEIGAGLARKHSVDLGDRLEW